MSSEVDEEPLIRLREFLPYQLVNLAKKVSDACSSIYTDAFGISIAEWRILAYLGERKDVTAQELCENTTMDKSRVSRAVGQLDEKGMLVKNKDPQDSRALAVSLSKKGMALYKEIAPKVLDWEADLLEALTGAEYRDLERIFEKLDKRVEKL